jgi:glycosyltransferase involved in cell wall biosynthesis
MTINTPPRILIDLSNLYTGGGLQVGASFLDEMVALSVDPECVDRWAWLSTMTIEASPAVVQNATGQSLRHPALREVNGRPLDQVRRRHVVDHDVSFVLFGPDYAPRRAIRRVVGFADGISLHPEFAAPDTVAKCLRLRIRARLSRARFARYERVVVEAGHVARILEDEWGMPGNRISVVPNTLNGVFLDKQKQEDIPTVIPAGATFCFPTRAHRHKNLAVLGQAARELHARRQLDVRFVLTLTDREWRDLPEETRRHSVNVGPLRIAQVPALYRACTGAVFSSLVECFSATPLEAIASGAPLVASDRDFVRDVVGEAAIYFEPTDPASLASALVETVTNLAQRRARVEHGYEIANSWPTARDRALRYAELIDQEAKLTSR